MYHHRIVNQRLDTGHRQILLFLTCKSPGYVDGREGHVEVECESLFLTRLAVGESCVLLAVSQEELNLEPCPVDVHNVLCRHIDVCGEEHLPGRVFLPGSMQSTMTTRTSRFRLVALTTAV